MAKIQLLAILSLDGCLADMKTEGRWWLRPDCHGISDIYNKATFELSPDYSMTTLIAEHEKQDDNTVYLIEATHQNADFINALPGQVLSALRLEKTAEAVRDFLPFAENGFGWICPALLGLVIGILYCAYKKSIYRKTT